MQQEFTSLLREICAPSTPATEGAAVREDRREGTEVSRGHSTGSNEPGKTPDGLTTREGLNLAGSTTITGRRLALMPNGGAGREPAWQRKSAAQSLGTARNRRTRTRMSGGVGAGRSILPATRSGNRQFIDPRISGHNLQTGSHRRLRGCVRNVTAKQAKYTKRNLRPSGRGTNPRTHRRKRSLRQ